jgi:hypothetical protein
MPRFSQAAHILSFEQGSHTAPVSAKAGALQRRHLALQAADTAHETVRGLESCATREGEASCSTAGSTPAFLARKGVLNTRGQIMLKSLTYAELEQWCISVGVLQHTPPTLLSKGLPAICIRNSYFDRNGKAHRTSVLLADH